LVDPEFPKCYKQKGAEIMLEYENTYNTFNNPIPRSGLFATPSLENIQTLISNLPAKEQANASMVFMFTLNACNLLVQEEILDRMGDQ
jgi:hypothetical protein